MTQPSDPLLIKRYASRRLYNTETSDYVTLDDLAGFIRQGREIKIVDLKSGDDLTRQYLLQIVAEHENRGENVLPVSVLTDLVRSYTTQAQSVVPDFLAASFEMLKQGQSSMMDNMAVMNPMASMPGFEAMRAQQQAFFEAMTTGMGNWPDEQPQDPAAPKGKAAPSTQSKVEAPEDLAQIKAQLAELQDKLSKM